MEQLKVEIKSYVKVCSFQVVPSDSIVFLS